MHIWAMRGNFHRLGSYAAAPHAVAPAADRGSTPSWGCTLANLDDEAQFVMDNLNAVARPNDYLFLICNCRQVGHRKRSYGATGRCARAAVISRRRAGSKDRFAAAVPMCVTFR